MENARKQFLDLEENLLLKTMDESGKLMSLSKELSIRTAEMNAEFSFFMPSEFVYEK